MVQLHLEPRPEPFFQRTHVRLTDVQQSTEFEQFGRELRSLRSAWKRYRTCRDRDAVYDFLDAVFRAAKKWKLAGRAKGLVHPALGPAKDPIGGLIIVASSGSIDRRTACKWSRALRYALKHKSAHERLEQFMLGRGGVNACASKRK